MDVELKPCPFCGSAAKIWKPEVGNGPDAAMCTNKDCDASVYFITPEHWNTRHGAGDADHSPDAGKMADDRSAELTTAWMAGVERERERATAEAWRSIESAPRDGTTVIVWFKQHGALSCRWTDRDDDSSSEWAHWHVDDFKHGPFPVRGYNDGDATHWRPLPAPPTEDAARAGERG